MHRTALVALIALSAGCASTVPQRLALSPQAENNLSFMYDHMEVEFGFCAYGKEKGGAVEVKRVSLAFMEAAGRYTSEYAPCEGRGLLGYGHSHVQGEACELSKHDVLDFAVHGRKYTLLVCESSFRFYAKVGEHLLVHDELPALVRSRPSR